MSKVSGTTHQAYEPVREALANGLDSGAEVGASIYVDIGGEPVVDIHGGWQDREQTAPWTEETVVTLWSTTKTVTALAVLTLVERGEIDVFSPVSRYWPEFAQNGKENIEVRHLLSHTSGVSGWEQPFSHDDAYDIEAVTAKLATQPPWWEPGQGSAYHASTFGPLNGELVRRVSGKTLTQFVAEDLAGPVGADFHIGMPEDQTYRVATVYAPVVNDMAASLPTGDGPAEGSLLAKTLAGSMASIEAANTPEWRKAELGHSNGHGNARSVAQLLSAVTLDGTTNGVAVAVPKTIDLIFQEQANGVDMYLSIPLRWGIGYALTPSGGVPFIRDGRVCFWGGWGGSMIIMDLDRRMTISYVMNQMKPGTIGSEAAALYCDAIYRCFDAA